MVEGKKKSFIEFILDAENDTALAKAFAEAGDLYNFFQNDYAISQNECNLIDKARKNFNKLCKDYPKHCHDKGY